MMRVEAAAMLASIAFAALSIGWATGTTMADLEDRKGVPLDLMGVR